MPKFCTFFFFLLYQQWKSGIGAFLKKEKKKEVIC